MYKIHLFYFNIENRRVGFRSINCSDRNMSIRRVQEPYKKKKR